MSNFNTFLVNSTNIFPIANSTAGGQLLSEINIRSRESVSVGPTSSEEYISYFCGASYTRSEDDFKVSIQTNEANKQISSTVLVISKGKAVVNGHYIENLSPMIVDVAEAKTAVGSPASGDMAIGIRIMYSGIDTMSGESSIKTYGTMKVENSSSGYYEGVQIVVLPQTEFKTPYDSPKNQTNVTAHLKLATFTFVNGTITNLVNNPDKCQMIDATRIRNVNDVISADFLSRPDVDPNQFYVVSGKSQSGNYPEITWCKVRDAMFKWCSDNETYTSTEPLGIDKKQLTSAEFRRYQDKIYLNVPHKHVDGSSRYYPNIALPIPSADYVSGTAGTVSRAYTDHIKAISSKLDRIYSIGNGNCLGICSERNRVNNVIKFTFIDSSKFGSTPLSESEIINKVKSSVATGDYIVVIQDKVDIEGSGIDSFPATMYVFNKNADSISLQGPVYLTYQLAFATETAIGGFLNCSETDLDGGYVMLDDTGHLRLLDYDLLRNGVLAYQLGQDMSTGSNLTLDAIQSWLDEYINNRVAFSNDASVDTINVTIVLPDDSSSSESNSLYVRGLDSRFGTSVYFHIVGSGTSKTTVNFIDCEKLRIDSNITIQSGSNTKPNITLTNCNLYYDSSILSHAASITGLKLWYEKDKDTDPDLFVDGMTVKLGKDANIRVEDLDFWSETTNNDNHLSYALCGITFADTGDIIGADIYIKNNIDKDTMTSLSSYFETNIFNLPQGSTLHYPENRLTTSIIISGTFINGFSSNGTTILYKVDFSASTGSYVKSQDNDSYYLSDGNICMMINRYDLRGNNQSVNETAWNTDSFHVFSGWIKK